MRDTIIKNMNARFDAWLDLANSIDEGLVKQELPVEKNKSLKVHFWCVVGARESYTKSLEEGAWAGFSCSLDVYSPEGVAAKLQASAQAFNKVVNDIDDWTTDREELLASLAEHETMHEGQVIRLIYGLGHTLPPSWKWA